MVKQRRRYDCWCGRCCDMDTRRRECCHKERWTVTIANTRQYASQMPNQTIAIKKWAYDHRTDIENMIIALAQAR
jgi:hypothetical protein